MEGAIIGSAVTIVLSVVLSYSRIMAALAKQDAQRTNLAEGLDGVKHALLLLGEKVGQQNGRVGKLEVHRENHQAAIEALQNQKKPSRRR